MLYDGVLTLRLIFNQPHIASHPVFRQVFLYYKIVYYEVLAFHGVLSHVVFQKFLHLVCLVQGHLLQSHLRTYEMCELLR